MYEFKGIPDTEEWDTVSLVNKGWSGEIKYHIKTKDDRQQLLRLSDISTFERKKKEYEAVKMLNRYNILMSRPVDLGMCNDRCAYILFTWLNGTYALKT